MSIYINGTVAPFQPSALTEEILQIQADNQSINGSMQRNKIGQKKQATLLFQQCNPTQYQNLLVYFTTGSGVTYLNDQSNYAGGLFTFSGLPAFAESQYVTGASLLRDFQVRIREV